MQDIIRRQLQESIRLELDHATTLRRSVLRAQEELRKELEKMPDKFLYSQMQTTVNQMVDHLDSYLGGGLDAKASLELGLKSSQPLVAASAGIPGSSAYWNFSPVMPIRAIGLANSEYINLIQKVTEDLKVDIMSEVKLSLTLGEGIGALRERVLGTGIPGLIGKDSKFRPAALRAEMIGRTVTNDLVNRGAMEGYRQINKEFPQLNIRKEWGSQSDRRTSKICLDLNGQIRPLDEDFQGNFWSGPNPPAHVSCRSRALPLADSYQSIYEREWKNKPEPPEPKPEPKPEKTSKKAKGDALSDKLPKPAKVSSDPTTYKHYSDKASEHLGKTEAKLDKLITQKATKETEFQQKFKELQEEITRLREIEDFKGAERLINKSFSLQDKHTEAIGKLEEKIYEEFRSIKNNLVARGSPLDLSNFEVPNDLPGWNERRLKNVMEEFSSLTQGRGVRDLRSVGYTSDRAYARRASGYINLGSQGTKEDFFHEMGHFLEFSDKNMVLASKDFIQSRATGDPVPLKELIPNANYPLEEVAYPDHFVHPYVGKEYKFMYQKAGLTEESPTEVISMGIERFSNPGAMSKLYSEDKEHFMFILGVLI